MSFFCYYSIAVASIAIVTAAGAAVVVVITSPFLYFT